MFPGSLTWLRGPRLASPTSTTEVETIHPRDRFGDRCLTTAEPFYRPAHGACSRWVGPAAFKRSVDRAFPREGPGPSRDLAQEVDVGSGVARPRAPCSYGWS